MSYAVAYTQCSLVYDYKQLFSLFVYIYALVNCGIEWSRMLSAPAVTTDGWMKQTLVTREHWMKVDNDRGIYVFGK